MLRVHYDNLLNAHKLRCLAQSWHSIQDDDIVVQMFVFAKLLVFEHRRNVVWLVPSLKCTHTISQFQSRDNHD